MQKKTYKYVGPENIRDAALCAHSERVRVRGPEDVLGWVRETGQEPDFSGMIPATFVVDSEGKLWIADRRSEHVACARGEDVLSAGEIFFCVEGDRGSVPGGLPVRRTQTGALDARWFRTGRGGPRPLLFGGQHLADFVGELVAGEGFAEEFDTLVEHPAVRDDVGGVAAHEQAFHLRPVCLHLLGQVAPALARHDHVGDQQVDLAGVLGCQAQGLFRAVRRQHGVAKGFEEQRRGDADGLLVFDQQDGLVAAG